MSIAIVRETFTSAGSSPAIWLFLAGEGDRCELEVTIEIQPGEPAWDAACVTVLFQPIHSSGLPSSDPVVLLCEAIRLDAISERLRTGFLRLPKSLPADRVRRCYFRVVPGKIGPTF